MSDSDNMEHNGQSGAPKTPEEQTAAQGNAQRTNDWQAQGTQPHNGGQAQNGWQGGAQQPNNGWQAPNNGGYGYGQVPPQGQQGYYYNGQYYNGQVPPNGQNGYYNGYNGQQPYGYQPQPPQSSLSVLSILGFVFAFVASLVGLILSIVAYNTAKREGDLRSQNFSRGHHHFGCVYGDRGHCRHHRTHRGLCGDRIRLLLLLNRIKTVRARLPAGRRAFA